MKQKTDNHAPAPEEQTAPKKRRRSFREWLWDAQEHPERFDLNIQEMIKTRLCPAIRRRWQAFCARRAESAAQRRAASQRWLADGGGNEQRRGSYWDHFVQNMSNWAWYHHEHPDWYDLDLQTIFKRRVAAPVRKAFRHLKKLRRAKRQRKFPESRRRIGQFFLFVLGSIPRVTGIFHEKHLSHRKSVGNVQGNVRQKFEHLKIRPVTFVLGSLALAVILMAPVVYTVGTTAKYDGVELGTAGSRGAIVEAVKEIEEVTRETMDDKDYEVDRSKLELTTRVLRRAKLTDDATLKEKLSDQIGVVDYGYSLYVDDEIIAATPFAGALEELLDQLQKGYYTENTVECGFVEDVRIEEGYVPAKYMTNLGYIAKTLNDTKAGEVTYKVKSGDVWSEISAMNNMSDKDLLKLNPGYDPAVLQVGDELTISNAVPYLTVLNIERQSQVQNIPYRIKYKNDPTMYEGDSEVLRKGSYGKADVTANVTYVNGEEIDRETVASVTLREPEAELQARGTKKRPTWHPTGNFRWPCSGVITSYFGYRDAGVVGASSYHEGIDVGNYTGAPVWAADGGTVVYAGWGGGYGYLVKIDHGNGFVSYYAHLNSILVSVGDHVYKGEQIAEMGSTGISSGPHLHFGLLKNDTWVDPLDYLS